MSKDADTSVDTIEFDASSRRLGVVLGFDGSDHAKRALIYAARAAKRRGSILTVVTSFTIAPAVYTTLAAIPRTPDRAFMEHATKEIQDQARELLTDYPGEVSYLTEEGDAAGVLVEKSRDAQLVVVGARGLGGFMGLLLGSVASALPAHSHAPTVVVPADYDDSGDGAARFDPAQSSDPVVVGIDESEQSRVAVLHAAEAAAERGATLELLMVLPPVDGALLWYPELRTQALQAAEQRKSELQETVDAERDWLRGHFPDLDIEATVATGDPITVLRKKSRSAQLIAVGTRGRGGFKSVVLGSVSRGLLVRAEGPVLVVPNLRDSRV